MQNSIYLDRPGHQTALIRHFGELETTLVIGEMAVGWNVRQREGLLYPDLLIAFDVDPQRPLHGEDIPLRNRGSPRNLSWKSRR